MTRETTELTEQQLSDLVDRFYDKIQIHPTLGPVFNAAVHDWPEHKLLLTSFWSSVALGTRSYRGNPMAQHRGHNIHAGHFDEWLALWRVTADEVLDAEHAAMVHEYAKRIGRSLKYGLGLQEGVRSLELPIVGV